MRLESSAYGASSFLCSKGLAIRSSLVAFIQGVTVAAAEADETMDNPDVLRLRRDELVIRDIFNNRYGALDVVDPAARDSERAKREALLRSVYRLYQAGRNSTPEALRRDLNRSEVETLISSFRRLSLMSARGADEFASHCARCAANDEDLLAHVIDPLQLRYVLSCYDQSTANFIGTENVNTLLAASRRHDRDAVLAWFASLEAHIESLPKDTPQFLRSLLFDLWRAGEGDLGVLAREIAILDVRLFQDLGWETTRLFCVQLRRITGPGTDALDVYLTDEDVDSALAIAEAVKQDDLIAHFRKLASSYSTKLHRDIYASVTAAANRSTSSTPFSEGVPAQSVPGTKNPYSGLSLSAAAS
jgi:hypothetical protein